MIAELISVGTELLMGQIVNTNSWFISNLLPDYGYEVYYHTTVGDNPARLEKCLKTALERSDVVITTGGLGPTQDDITKEIAAKVCECKMIFVQSIHDDIKEFFRKRNREMPEQNLRQAYIPEGAILLNNRIGTAPGCIIEYKGKKLILLPGPPNEMEMMFTELVLPYLEQSSGYKLVSRYVKLFGIGESQAEDRIIDLIKKQTNPTIAPYVKDGLVLFRITAKCKHKDEGAALIEPIINEMQKRLGEYIYSTDGKEMEQVVVEKLIQKGKMIALAESCTGGLISAALTSVPGASKILDRCVVSYSNKSKTEELGVKEETLNKYGAVSFETAVEMAEGIKNISKTDIGIAVTGIAGPTGATNEKPVGLVYIAFSDNKETVCEKYNFVGDRERIRRFTMLTVLDILRRKI